MRSYLYKVQVRLDLKQRIYNRADVGVAAFVQAFLLGRYRSLPA